MALIMDDATAKKLNDILSQLKSAEEQFKYCNDNGIMNGYPIRIIKECKQILQESLHSGLPNEDTYPELHVYLSTKYVTFQQAETQKKKIQMEKIEADEKIKKFNESPEGKKAHIKEKISKIEQEIKLMTQEQHKLQQEASSLTMKAAEIGKRTQDLYREITMAQISLLNM